MSDNDASPRRRDSRSRSASPVRRSPTPSRSRSRSRTRSPRRENPVGDDWRSKLDALYDKGSIRRGDIEDNILKDLESLPPSDASHVVDRLTQSDTSRIRNMNGFIGGIIRRVRADAVDGSGDGTLPGSIKDFIDDLIKDGKLESNDVDERVTRGLCRLGEDKAKEALTRFESSVDSSVRSKQGFLMGIVKRLSGAPFGGGRGGGYGSRGRFDDRDRVGYGGGRDRGYDDRDRGGYGGGRDRGYGGGRDRGYDDRDRGGYGGGRDRGYDDRERGGYGGGRDRGYGGRDGGRY